MLAQLLWSNFNIKDIITKLEEVRSAFLDAVPLQGILTCLDSRAIDVPAYKHNRTSLNNKLEKPLS